MLIATAGHVDHGKTTLIKALSGVDTDKLPEEKKRGLTIELGFAYVTDVDSSGCEQTLGFIDVPGHEKFVRNMLSGVGAIDLALLVVAADDGIMPQTREHVAILDLLGISVCVVALTRADLVSDSRIAEVSTELAQLLQETDIDCLSCIPVSAPVGRGIDTLRKTLLAQAALLSPRESQAYFRLAIDRCFSVRGAGTVVTGAVFSGTAEVGDSVRLLPGQQRSRIREIHANGAVSDKVVAGQRAALNLTNVDLPDIHKGNWVTSVTMDVVSSCLDARCKILSSETRPIRHWTPVHVHSGAQSNTGRLALYDARQINPGDESYVQLVVDKPMHMVFGDRFVLRDQSASRTIGGGCIIDPFASRHRRFRRGRVAILEVLDTSDHESALTQALALSPAGLPEDSFQLGRNIAKDEFETLLVRHQVQRFNDASSVSCLIARSVCDAAKNVLLEGVQTFHVQNPQLGGIGSSELRSISELTLPVFEFSLQTLIREAQLLRVGNVLKLKQHEVILSEADQTLLQRILTLVTADTLKPPPLADLAAQLEMERDSLADRMSVIVGSGHLVKVTENRFYHPQALEKLADVVRTLAGENESAGFDARRFRDQSGIGRNVSIDVLEYFDRVGLTQRIADRRWLKRTARLSNIAG